jgi:hypothetical protein
MEQLMINLSEYITNKQNITLLNEILIGTKNLNDKFEIVIEFMLKYLNSTNNDFRKNTMQIFSLIIERLSKLKLSNNEILLIFNIAKDRLTQRPLSGSCMKIIYCMDN